MLYSILLCLLFNITRSPEKIILFDMQLKKPCIIRDSFTDGDLFKGYFPIYSSDITSLKEACHKAGKLIDTGSRCNSTDTVYASHSIIVIHTYCQSKKAVSVMLITALPGKRIAYHLSENEENPKSAQVKLADLSGHLNKELTAFFQKPQL